MGPTFSVTSMRPSGRKAIRQGSSKVLTVVMLKGTVASGFCWPILTWAQAAGTRAGCNALIADAWQAVGYQKNQVIEAPIGWLQMAQSTFAPGNLRPLFPTVIGATCSDGTGSWICIGRSKYATCIPDEDGTQNQGGISNPALVVADYLQTSRQQFGLGVTLDADALSSVVAAANICDEPVAIEVFADATTLYERRYACNGCFESSSAYGDVLKSLALSMAGFVVPPGDTWRVYAGSYVAPTLTLTDGDARAGIKADFRLSARDTCNTVTGQFIAGFLPINPNGPLNASPANPAWKKTDFPPVQVASYVTEDGIILPKDLQLDFTISLWMAQRIARIVLERLRRQITITLPAKISALQCQAGDTLTFLHPNWESTSPPMPTVFQIASLSLRLESGQGGAAPSIGVDLVLRQTDANVYVFAPPTSPTNFGDYSPYGQTGIGAGDIL